MNGRVRPGDVGLVSQPPRTPASAPTQLTDAGLLVGRHPLRRAPRAAGALLQAGQRPAVLRTSSPPAAHPLPDGRLRDVRPGGRLGERLAFLDDSTRDFPPSYRRVTGSMVRHFRDSSRDVSSNPRTPGRPGPTPRRFRKVPGPVS